MNIYNYCNGIHFTSHVTMQSKKESFLLQKKHRADFFKLFDISSAHPRHICSTFIFQLDLNVE